MSGVYIPGIETSKTCAFCRFCDGIADTQLGACAFCVVDGKVRGADTTPKDCPLIPVPSHGRLIDADALQVGMMEMVASGMYGEEDCIDAVIEAPTIIPADPAEEGEG